MPAPRSSRATGIVIVGGGIAGLSAGWQLLRQGFTDFKILELEADAGGNSRAGVNSVSPYPWGAHYVPLPGPRLTHVRALFEELGVITGYDLAGRPRYNEFHLCASPQERLYLHGQWQEGLLPQIGVSAEDRAQYEAFFAEMERWKAHLGRRRGPTFALPIDQSDDGEESEAFDRITMARYLEERGWNSKPLRWYVDYCCRDDYGTRIEDVSAWAAIHYFASRHQEPTSGEEHSVLTWPAGNGWIVEQLRLRLAPHLETHSLALRVEPSPSGVELHTVNTQTGDSTRLRGRAAILAVPQFVAERLLPTSAGGKRSHGFSYAPWAVVNLTVSHAPSGRGAALAWDNVIYGQQGLGYVVATHQNIARFPSPKSVLTYYLPLTHRPPMEARHEALQRSPESWTDQAIAELSVAHPELGATVEAADVWLWGHGMIRPTPGFLTGPERRRAAQPQGAVFFAHSDLSGISLFEEAQYRGVTAADASLRFLRRGKRLG